MNLRHFLTYVVQRTVLPTVRLHGVTQDEPLYQLTVWARCDYSRKVYNDNSWVDEEARAAAYSW